MNVIRYFWPAFGWAIFILFICNASLGEVSDSPMFFEGFDKLTHTGLFFVQTVFIIYGLQKIYGKLNFIAGFFVGLCSIAFGALIEVLQIYVFTWRSGEWADLFCDGVGIGMALFAACILQWGLKR
ncbi:MAG: VanZ family protein [Mucilaginibacter polytrichastri]|nr:VanZ family protein [Mucilaginibacter polytrichastri]